MTEAAITYDPMTRSVTITFPDGMVTRMPLPAAVALGDKLTRLMRPIWEIACKESVA